eukprot:jgi/Chlat1/5903/Chrsp4S06394
MGQYSPAPQPQRMAAAGIPCRYGRGCLNPACKFAHPAGHHSHNHHSPATGPPIAVRSRFQYRRTEEDQAGPPPAAAADDHDSLHNNTSHSRSQQQGLQTLKRTHSQQATVNNITFSDEADVEDDDAAAVAKRQRVEEARQSARSAVEARLRQAEEQARELAERIAAAARVRQETAERESRERAEAEERARREAARLRSQRLNAGFARVAQQRMSEKQVARERVDMEERAVRRILASDGSDPHECLGVDRGASLDAIKRQYRALALTLHPDKNSSVQAKAAFQRVATAYRTLTAQLAA